MSQNLVCGHGKLSRERRRWKYFFPLLLPQMAALDLSAKIKDALVFYLFLLSIEPACGQATTSSGVLTFTPGNELRMDYRLNYYIGNVTVLCDGTGNTNELNDLFLSKNGDPSEKDVEEILQNRVPTDKKIADLKFFSGTIDSKKIQYTVVNPACEKDGVTFKCTVQAKGDPSPFSAEKALQMTVGDQEVRMWPKSMPDVIRTVSDRVVISCSAILGGIIDIDTTTVSWQWTERSEGQTSFRPVDDEHAKHVNNLKLTAVPCRGVNSTTIFSLIVQPRDNNRIFRCAYKNPSLPDADFNLTTAQLFNVGKVKLLDYGTEEPQKTVYTTSSLIGMILGVSSFVGVSCMGLLYVYRKNRTGKKYDIESALLKEEEEKLAEMEAKLGMPKAVAAAAAAAEPAAENPAPEQPAAAGEEGSTTATEDLSDASDAVDNATIATQEEDASTTATEEQSNA